MKSKRLIAVVETPNGNVWEQEIEWRLGESVKYALARYKRMLGRSYWVCDWYLA